MIWIFYHYPPLLKSSLKFPDNIDETGALILFNKLVVFTVLAILEAVFSVKFKDRIHVVFNACFGV